MDKKVKVVPRKARKLAKMRKDSGLSQDELAYLMFKDESKRQRIGRIERGEVEPTILEQFSWFKHCATGKERAEILKAVEVLEKITGKS